MEFDHGISKNIMAARGVLQELKGDDAELNHDMIEGETDLFEAIQSALDEIAECEIVKAGCDAMIEKMKTRIERANRRSGRLRGAIDQAFQIAEVKSHKFPTATITTKAIPRKPIIQDESAIPSKFFEPQPPKLDKKALNDAAKGGEDIPGVTMSNGGTTIQIRRG